jgi:hypothetical protein
MEQDQYVKINIKESVRAKLKEQARSSGKTLADYIEWLAGNPVDASDKKAISNEADTLLERLDYASEHPESTLSPEDQALIDNLQPGELPDCCQEIYHSYPVDPKDVCKHWTKGYVNYYGRKVLGYQNTLTGGTYFEYQPLYQQ